MSYLKKYGDKIGIIFILLLISFVISMKSGYNFFARGGNHFIDPDVFRCIGWLMTKGYVPYRDIFDHKGPLLYFIEHLACFFGTIRGIWIVEIFFLSASVIISYLFARKFNSRALSIFIVLLAFATWNNCGSHRCEELSILFILISTFFFIDLFVNQSNWVDYNDTFYLKKNDFIKLFRNMFDWRIILIGICFACTFFLKTNLCSIWIVFCTAIFIECIKNNNFRFLISFLISFTIGIIIISIPIICYLVKNDAFNAFIYDYFIFNRLYISDITRSNIWKRIYAIFTLTNIQPCILAFAIIIFKLIKRDELFKFDVIYAVYMALSIILITMPGFPYVTLEQVLIPLFIYPFSVLFNIILKNKKNGEKIITLMTAMILFYLSGTIVYPSWAKQIAMASLEINKYVYEPKNRGMYDDEIVRYIKKHSSSSDKIAVFGNRCVYYMYSEREPASKYIYLPDPSIDKNIIKEYFSDLRTNNPKIIVIASKYKGKNEWVAKKMKDYLSKEGYNCVREGKYPVYSR